MLRVENITVDHGRVRALWDVDFVVGHGESVALLGTDGAGKSTTLGAICGIYSLALGDILLEGDSIRGRRVRDIVSRGVVLVPEGRRLWPEMSVLENLEMGAYLPARRRDRAAALERVFDVFPAMREKSSRPAYELSGGQQAMVAIGRALMANPRLLLLDEPFIGMSPLIVQEIKKVLRTARERHGLSMLIVDQDFKRAMDMAERTYVLSNGRTVMHGSSKDMLSDPAFTKTFLGLSGADFVV